MIKENIKKLQSLMKEKGIDIYIIPTSDFHQSEYVGEYFKGRKFLSGFTGSAGTLVVTLDKAYLWTDGRYFIQAQQQLEGSDIILMKMAMPNVPTIKEFLDQNADKTVGFDGRVMSYKDVCQYKNKLITNIDLVDEIWSDRPSISHQPAYLYDEKYCGESRVSKLKRIREAMNDCDYHIITSLDDIAWLFNIRGNDVACNPVVLAYSLISKNDATLYVLDGVIDKKMQDILKEDGIIVKAYNDIYEDVKSLQGKVLLDDLLVNYQICSNLNCEIVKMTNPTQYFKAIKK